MPLKKPAMEDHLRLALNVPNEIAGLMTEDEKRSYTTARHYADQLRQPGMGAELDSLTAMVIQGPVFDGDLPSKAGRSELIDHDLAFRTVRAGEDGYNAITSLGRDVFVHYWSPDNPQVSLGKAVAEYWRHVAERRAASAVQTA